jgi:hypothetical protein
VRRDLLVDCAEHLRRAVSAVPNGSLYQLTYARHFEGVEKAGRTVETDVVLLRWRCRRLRFVTRFKLASRGFALR